jgi:hypothetical protein
MGSTLDVESRFTDGGTDAHIKNIDPERKKLDPSRNYQLLIGLSGKVDIWLKDREQMPLQYFCSVFSRNLEGEVIVSNP